MIGVGFGVWPVNSATIADAAILAWLLAMLPDFGIAGADRVESPSPCTFGTATDSMVNQFTSHQRSLVVIRPDDAAMLPARIGGSTFSTSPLKLSNSVLMVRVFTSTSRATSFGTYSIRPG